MRYPVCDLRQNLKAIFRSSSVSDISSYSTGYSLAFLTSEFFFHLFSSNPEFLSKKVYLVFLHGRSFWSRSNADIAVYLNKT